MCPQNSHFLDTTLLDLSKQQEDTWRIRDAVEGLQIFGGPGSGKTSGSGAAFALSFLEHGLGGLVLAGSSDERQIWESYAKQTGRTDDLIIFGPEESWRFNFLRYVQEWESIGAGHTEIMVSLLLNALEVDPSGKKGNEVDWSGLRQLLRNTIDLLRFAGRPVSLQDIYKVIATAPQSLSQINDKQWRLTSTCAAVLNEAYQGKSALSRLDHNDCLMTLDFFFKYFLHLAPKPRSVMVSRFLDMAEGLLRGIISDMFCGEHNLKPELTHEGKIIIVDFPVDLFAESGQTAQILFKDIWRQAADRRPIDHDTAPVFLWCDNAPLFVTSNDAAFLANARRSRVCTVYLAQSFPKYLMVLGGSKERTSDLLGHLRTFVFHGNAEVSTNQLASALVGQLDPAAFTTLRMGGHHNDLKVDAFIFQLGRKWKSEGKNFTKYTFEQEPTR